MRVWKSSALLASHSLSMFDEGKTCENGQVHGIHLHQWASMLQQTGIETQVMWESKKAMNTDILLTPTGHSL